MEHEPLISGDSRNSHVKTTSRTNGHPSLGQKSLRSFSLCIFALELCIKFGATLLELPYLRLVERMVCKRYSGSDHGGGDEAACKSPAVQNKVSFIIGYKIMMDAVPCLLMVVFYGTLSNSWGRRFVIMLQITGRLLALAWVVLIGFVCDNVPVEALWISSLFLFIGGGRKAEVSMVYTSFCDIVPEGKRTRILALVHAAEGLAGIFSYPISSSLMKQQLWTPFAMAVAVCLVEYTILWYTPETSPFVDVEHRTRNMQSPRSSPAQSTKKSLQGILVGQLEYKGIREFFQHRGIIIILFSFFCKRIAFGGEEMVPQYVSETLHRRISDTYWFQACNHFGMLLTLGVLIPSFTYGLVGPRKDLWVIYGSLINVIIGFGMLWRGRNINVVLFGLLACGLGEGLDVGLQSLGSYIIGEKNHGTFFPVASMLGVAGELLGGPLMAATYAVRDGNGAPLGYCFLLSSVLFTCLLIGSQFITTKKFSA